MATLVLGTIGRAIGGPLGGIVGTFLGGAVDRAVFGGGGKARESARLSNLAVQSSAYGEPLPRLYGRMRVAGNLIWTSGIAEHATTTGGGKRSGPRTTSYSYSSSFAVALSARQIAGLARIWADGKLLRDADGAWLVPATLRLHDGGEGQAADPLIAAAEGVGACPAYRGLAYVVFEDLPLADYGNRIPNLTFEVIADVAVDTAVIVADLCAGTGVAAVGGGPAVTGYAAVRTGSVRVQLAPVVELCDLRLHDDGDVLTIAAGAIGPVAAVAAGDVGCVAAGSVPRQAPHEARAAAGSLDDAVAIGFDDPGRDFQPGLQRAARRGGVQRAAQIDVAMALTADVAKGLAEAVLARRAAARTSATLTLPPRRADLRAGTLLTRPGDPGSWAVRRWTFSGFVSELTIERLPARRFGSIAADAGRAHDPGDAAPGSTTLHLLDLPSLSDALDTAPRLLIAAAGASRGWRRSSLAISRDGGDSYADAGEIGAASAMGTTTTGLAAGDASRWDRVNSVDLTLICDTMWLESRSEASVLGGSNAALIGNEIVQFASVQPLGGSRFRLSTLLRGRRGSAVAAHPAGSRFVVLDATRLLAVEPGNDALGRTLLARATGSGDGAATLVATVFAGVALRPLSPVFVRRADDGGDSVFGWTRRSRSGFAWLDGADAPLGEAREAYRATLVTAAGIVRSTDLAAPTWRYTAAARAADGLARGATVELAVAQLSEVVGAGDAARATFILP